MQPWEPEELTYLIKGIPVGKVGTYHKIRIWVDKNLVEIENFYGLLKAYPFWC